MGNLKEKYYTIKEYIDKVDFTKLWDGFRPLKFALYNQDECFFDGEYIEKTNEFIANTSIKYKGEYIAIWNVLEEVDPIIMASKMIHEMFHGYQMMNNETRFPNELEALSNYKYSDQNLSLKYEENKLIVNLVDKFDMDTFNSLLSFRKSRSMMFPYEYLYESKIEQIEGCANYVELNSLKQLSKEKYLEKLNKLKNNLLNKANYLPIRVLCYDIGALILNILVENSIIFDKGFSADSFSLSIINGVCAKEMGLKSHFKKQIDEYYGNAKEIIDKALIDNNVIAQGEYDILGVNYYNAICYDNYIISTFFVMYGIDGDSKVEYGNFVIETKAYNKLTKIYKY